MLRGLLAALLADLDQLGEPGAPAHGQVPGQAGGTAWQGLVDLAQQRWAGHLPAP